MKLPIWCGAILLAPMLTACATHETPPIADSACLVFSRLTYAIPPAAADGLRAMAVDPGNLFDTEETVGQVREHNARYGAVCEGK